MIRMKRFIYGAAVLMAMACGNDADYDAQGTFEATEVIVSAEATGRILDFDIAEGDSVAQNQAVGAIDSLQLHLQCKQLMAQQSAIIKSRPDKGKQVASLREQIAKQRRELARVENMLRDGAATQKQHDDIKAQINILEGQLSAALSTLDKNTASLDDNAAAMEAQIAALNDKISKCRISSPISGVVMVKYAEAGEFAQTGRALMKVADVAGMKLRAYITATQLNDLKIGQQVTVYADQGEAAQRTYKGKVVWISNKAEFTPKTIQTRDERANLVYAVKIAVQNDGFIKQGMYGEVKF